MATILAVDDEGQIRTLVALILGSAGHAVVTASNGVEGIAFFRSTPDRFDVVVTDLKMPVMDGHQLVELVRETSVDAKILCMSGYSNEPIPPGTDFLQKPFLVNALRASVDKLLAAKRMP
jgi:two-component system cell cycle sensor histidine kinase/response regulator CckA